MRLDTQGLKQYRGRLSAIVRCCKHSLKSGSAVTRLDDFFTHLGISSKVLASRLNYLVDTDILRLCSHAGGKRAVEYKLTPKGRDLFPLLVFMVHWADRWWPLTAGPCIEALERASSQPVKPILVRNARGRTVGPQQTMVVQGTGGSKAFLIGKAIVDLHSEKTRAKTVWPCPCGQKTRPSQFPKKYNPVDWHRRQARAPQ
jgi:DNA-binding HxlR family transcriptional regulator